MFVLFLELFTSQSYWMCDMRSTQHTIYDYEKQAIGETNNKFKWNRFRVTNGTCVLFSFKGSRRESPVISRSRCKKRAHRTIFTYIERLFISCVGEVCVYRLPYQSLPWCWNCSYRVQHRKCRLAMPRRHRMARVVCHRLAFRRAFAVHALGICDRKRNYRKQWIQFAKMICWLFCWWWCLTCGVYTNCSSSWRQNRTVCTDTVVRWCAHEYVCATPTALCSSTGKTDTHVCPVLALC